jgi:hypothetical protein
VRIPSNGIEDVRSITGKRQTVNRQLELPMSPPIMVDKGIIGHDPKKNPHDTPRHPGENRGPVTCSRGKFRVLVGEISCLEGEISGLRGKFRVLGGDFLSWGEGPGLGEWFRLSPE